MRTKEIFIKENHIKLDSFFQACERTIFPREIFPPKKINEVLLTLYPTIKFERVRFFSGLPWFANLSSISVSAQALPDTYSFNKFNIYLLDEDDTSCSYISTVVHEAVHILQYLKFAKGYGIGYFRGFMVYYIAYFIQHGYMKNPFEIPAYQQEMAFYRFCTENNYVKQNSFKDSLLERKEFRKARFDFSFEGNYFYLLLSLIFNLLIMIIKPLIEVLMRLHIKVMIKIAAILNYANLAETKE